MTALFRIVVSNTREITYNKSYELLALHWEVRAVVTAAFIAWTSRKREMIEGSTVLLVHIWLVNIF